MIRYFAIALGLLSLPAARADTINAAGQVGLTSYIAPPFQTQVYQQQFNASPGQAPVVLFYANGKTLLNAVNIKNSIVDGTAKTAAGTVPYAGMQRYDDTYNATMPATPNEPAYVAADRYLFTASVDAGAYAAWSSWHTARASSFMLNSDGTVFGHQTWGANSGHISPLQPIPSTDYPPGGLGATYGDFLAYRYGAAAAVTKAYGVELSDYFDSQPSPSFASGFNPEIIAQFGGYIGSVIPGATVATQSAWIVSHVYNQWNDFLAQGYGRFYANMAVQVAAGSGHLALIADQCGLTPAQRRLYGTDQRILKGFISSANYTCLWDNQTIQSGRTCQDIDWSLSGSVLAAAREPDIRNGVNLEASDTSYAAGLGACYPSLTGTALTEFGLKTLKRGWLDHMWAHIATRQGTVRRALSFASKDYSDVGALDTTLTSLFQSITPTRPFGFALYYSTSAERTAELAAGTSANINNTYMTPEKLDNFINGGGLVGYYVSDAALDNLSAKPAAWVVLDGVLGAAELGKLQASAPVLASLAAAKAFANAPLAMSAGFTGFGFYDQFNRLIVKVTNLNAVSNTGTITITGLAPGAYVVTELFSGAVTALNVAQNVSGSTVMPPVGTLPLTASRWDTLVYSIVMLNGAG